MPIEVKELYIKINVDEANNNTSASANVSEAKSAAIIAACIEEVMERLKDQKER